jgi:hypothetical protein
MSDETFPFPATRPVGYEALEDEPVYDPSVHLRLEPPERVWTLAELGYSDGEIEGCASKVAITSAFRLLSDEGARAVLELARRLEAKRTRGSGERTAAYLAGGVYRSSFLHDLCNCPVVARFLGELAGAPLLPHTMPSQQLYINYAPEDLAKAVDTWHFDGIGFDYVLMASDPSALEGGEFQFFRGTRQEAAACLGLGAIDDILAGSRRELPADRVVTVSFPAAGFAVFQQGNMVVHRAARLHRRAERITLIPGYVSHDVSRPDPTQTARMLDYGEPGILTEVARHAASRARAKLGRLIGDLPFTDNRDRIRRELEAAIEDVRVVITRL